MRVIGKTFFSPIIPLILTTHITPRKQKNHFFLGFL